MLTLGPGEPWANDDPKDIRARRSLDTALEVAIGSVLECQCSTQLYITQK